MSCGMSWSGRSLTPISSIVCRPTPAPGSSAAMYKFLRRNELVKRGLASGKTRRRRMPNDLVLSVEYAPLAKWGIFALFIAGLALLIFNGKQPEPTKSFVVALLFFAAAVVQLWINQPKTFARNSRLFLVFSVIFIQLAATK